jgi:hypothetical protein
MPKPYAVTGRLISAQTITLDQALPLAPTKVRVVVEPLAPAHPRPYREVMAAIQARQARRGHRPRSRSEVDASLRDERASWDH